MELRKFFASMEHTGIYIVDRETLETYYENGIASKYSKVNRIGQPCYSIHGNKEMCYSCPIRYKDHSSLVHRYDLDMVFVMHALEIDWEGKPAYLISVRKDEDLKLRDDEERSKDRMKRALEKSISVYTELNMKTKRYRQVNLKAPGYFRVDPEGDYVTALEYMLQEEIDPRDEEGIRRVLSLEALEKESEKPEGLDEVSVRYRLKNVEPVRVMETRAIFMRDELPHYVVCLVKDVTAETETLRKALHEAQNANTSKTEFFSRMSHDMRTPMNGILGLAELSTEETDPVVLRNNMKQIKESGQYLLSLINDTLDFQRIESGKMTLKREYIYAQEVFDSLINLLERVAKDNGITFKIINRGANLDNYACVDVVRLKQIFINLVSNAVKFTPMGGTITMDITHLETKNGISYNCVKIIDTGIGMSKDFLKNRLFKPFEQESNMVSNQYAGSGLGLSIVKKIIELNDGHIEVESELGKGTTFACYLKFRMLDYEKGKKLVNEGKAAANRDEDIFKDKKILVVEDHPLNAKIAIKLLQKVGCQVGWASNGQEAVDMFVKKPQDFYNAILMDIRMPVLDGLEATKRIRRLDRADAKTVPIIAMSANAYAEDVQKSLAAGMHDHLSKPVDVHDLYETLAKYLKK